MAVIEINTILFKMTGLDHRVARFQVISMLTGTGYTTGESELIIEHPVRRRLGAFLILFGAFSLAVIISAITSILDNNFFAKEIGFVAAGLVVVLFILKIPRLQKKLSKWFEHDMAKHYSISELPISDVLLNNKEDHFTKVTIFEESPSIGKKLKDIIHEDEDIIILFITRGEINIRNERLEEELQAGDVIIVYGDKTAIEKRFKKDLELEKEQKEDDLKGV
jgi:hypothetical protein